MMMTKQRRMMCHECKREWIQPQTGLYMNSSPLTITGNKRDDLCPICGSGSIEEIIFTPSFLGGDIPRNEPQPIIELVKKEEPVAPGFIVNNLIANMIRDDKEEYNPVYDLSDMD